MVFKKGSAKKGSGLGGIKKTTGNHLKKPTILRLARRGGVKRISSLCYEEINHTLVNFLKKIIGDSVIYCEYAKRRSITVMDVLNALQKNGKSLYGVVSN